MFDALRRGIGYLKRKAEYIIVFCVMFPLYSVYQRLQGSNRQFPPIFIVGAPRTGSTILYQALTNCFNVKYVDNLSAVWYRRLPFGLWLSHRKYGLAPHGNYSAVHGSTELFGLHAPSECGDYWYRWLGKDQHFVDAGEVPINKVTAVSNDIRKASELFGLPILFKNLNMGQRLRFIKEVCPEARIIFIRRDPRFVVRSIMKARKKVGAKAGDWWSVRPRNSKELTVLPEEKMCAAQVFFIEQQIKQDLDLFPPDNVKTVFYNDFSIDLITEIAKWLKIERKGNGDFPDFHKDDPHLISGDDFIEINAAVAYYEFDEGSFI